MQLRPILPHLQTTVKWRFLLLYLALPTNLPSYGRKPRREILVQRV
nr:MAG TPA: hypothetical protein [Caudoviricetes sp.]